MAQTMQLVRPKETSQVTWNSTFPESLKTDLESTLFMKKLLAVSISNILYLRGIFDEDSFGDQSVDGLEIKILSKDCEYEGAKNVINWIRGCYDALEKKYLKQAMIGVYNDKTNPDDVIETYTFCFSYKDQMASVTLQDKSTPSETITEDNTKNATIILLRSISKIIKNFQPLPKTSYLTMKLLYFDNTPPDYEPLGFKSCVYNPFNFGDDDLKLDLGSVGTKYHNVKVKVKTSSFPGTDSNNNSQDSSRQLQNGNTEATGKENQPSSKNESQPIMDVDDDDQDVNCPCGDKSNDGLMLSCDLCKSWQHGVCFGVFEENDAPSDHICDICDDQNKNLCGDKIMVKLVPKKRSELAIMRRSLNHCEMSSKSTVTVNELVKKLDVSKNIAQNVLQKLEKENYVGSGKGRYKGKKIIIKKTIIEDGYKNYFKVDENSPIFVTTSIFDGAPPNKSKSTSSNSSTATNAEIDSITSHAESLSFHTPTEGKKRKANDSIMDDRPGITQSSISRKKISNT